jgi:hypothetical protein
MRAVHHLPPTEIKILWPPRAPLNIELTYFPN